MLENHLFVDSFLVKSRSRWKCLSSRAPYFVLHIEFDSDIGIIERLFNNTFRRSDETYWWFRRFTAKNDPVKTLRNGMCQQIRLLLKNSLRSKSNVK